MIYNRKTSREEKQLIKVLGRNNSVNVQKVMWIASELDLEIEREDIGGAFGGNDTQEYLAMNPNGRIPTLIDGDEILWESNTIVRYLAEKAGKHPWYPKNLVARGRANQWMDFYLTNMHAPMTVIFWQLIRTTPEKRDAAAFNKAVLDASKFWKIIDSTLANRPYLAGNAPDMGDVPLGCSAYRWNTMTFDKPDLPNVKAYFERLSARKAYQKNVMIPLT